MHKADTLTVEGVEVSLYYDQDAGSPYREWDTLGSLLMFDHRDLSIEALGAERMPRDDFRSTALAQRYLTLMEGYAAAVPFRIDNYGSGNYRAQTVSEDTERVDGFIVTTLERRDELGAPGRTSEELAKDITGEFEGDFASYIEGDVYGYVAADGTVDEDALWGLYGHEYAVEAATEAAQSIVESRRVAATRVTVEWMELSLAKGR